MRRKIFCFLLLFSSCVVVVVETESLEDPEDTVGGKAENNTWEGPVFTTEAFRFKPLDGDSTSIVQYCAALESTEFGNYVSWLLRTAFVGVMSCVPAKGVLSAPLGSLS